MSQKHTASSGVYNTLTGCFVIRGAVKFSNIAAIPEFYQVLRALLFMMQKKKRKRSLAFFLKL